MSNIHWRKLINPDYLGAYSLDNGDGTYRSAVFTIVSAGQKDVTGPDGTKQKLVLGLKESKKPMILNSTNARTLEKLYKTAYVNQWIGRQFEVGVESVKVGPNREDALRIRKFPPRSTEMPKCADTGAEIVATERMTAVQVVAWTTKKFGRPLCADRASELIEQAKAAESDEAPAASPAETAVQDE